MPWTIDADGKPEFVEDTPDRVAPVAAPPPRTAPPVPGAAEQHDRGSAVETLKGIGSSVLGGAFDTLLAPANLLDAATGGRGDASGRQFLENVVALAGRSNEKAQEYTEGQRRFAEEHPYLHGASQLAGQVLGGAPLGALAGAGSEALGLGRAGEAALVGATEGAAQNAASAREEAYIKNSDLTGEQMLAAMGWGALVGGGTGLAVNAAGKLLFGRAGSRGATPFDSPRVPLAEGEVPSLPGAGAADEVSGVFEHGAASGAEPAPKAPFGERFAEKLRGFAEERTTKALGARGSDIQKLGRTGEAAEAEMRRMSRDVLEGKLEDGTPIFRAAQSQDELVKNLVRAREEAGSALGNFREKVGAYIENKAPALRPKTADIADRIEQEVIAPLEQSAVPQVQSKASDVRGVVDGLRGLGDDVSLAQLQKVRQDLASIVYPKKVGPGLPAMPPASAAELQQAERIIEEHIEATVDRATTKMGGSDLGQYGTLKAKYRSYREAAQIASKADLQDLGNRVVSPSDYLAGIGGAAAAGAHGGPVAMAVAAASAAAHHYVREHASSVLAVLADRLAQTVDRKIGKGVDGFFERSLSRATTPRIAGEAARMVPSASARPAATVATPLALFLGKQKDKQVAYRARAQEVLDANADFGARIRNRTEATLGDLPVKAPKLAASMVTAATRGAQFLAAKLPAPIVNAQSFTPHASALPVSDVQLHEFARYWAAVSNPTSTIDAFERGTLSPEQVEATKAVYPQLYQTIVEKVTTRLRDLDAKGTFIPYTSRLQLDLLLDLKGSGEPTASPQFVAMFRQMQTAQNAAGGQEPGPTPPQRPINIASRLRSGRDALDPGAEPQ